MKVTYCGEYKGRPYRITAELTKSGKIVSFNAIYYPSRGGVSAVAIVPEKPVSTSLNPFNVKGRRFRDQFKEFLENSHQAEGSTIH
ncbi:MAG: hypothetical protein JW807_00770 [Spirochaetes bacterium]|nr:hypothetical protein [Spirochaetota bacterium]